MGKRRKSGKRDKSGRLLRASTRTAREPARIPGNDFIQRRAALFAIFAPENKPLKPEECSDAPGQAYVAGLLDNLPVDGKVIRDVARDFGDLYWQRYACMGAKTANIVGSPAGRGDQRTTASDRRFARLDESLGALSSPQRRAVYALCVDPWALDETPPFVERLINEQRVRRRQVVVGCLPTERDRALWVTVCAGLQAMVLGCGVERHNQQVAA